MKDNQILESWCPGLGPVTVLGESEYEDEPTKLPNPFHGNEEFTDMAYLVVFRFADLTFCY